MGVHEAGSSAACWCGNTSLTAFSLEYAACTECGTLISRKPGAAHPSGTADLAARSRQDLPERCVHWLRTLLTYRLPPATVLELGCGHGGLVALARQVGYDATGLEIDARAADFARQTFQVPVLHGPLEAQDLPAGSQDVIVLNDVLGCLADPVATLGHCGRLLREDGLLVVQAPDYPKGKSYAELVAGSEPTLAYVSGQAGAYRYLFSQCAVRRLFERLGFGHLSFERPIHPYDLYAVVSRRPLNRHSDEHIDAHLTATPQARLVRALFDLQGLWRAAEDDRAVRLEAITRLGQQVAAGEADRAALFMANAVLREKLTTTEADRVTRLDTVHRLNVQLTVTQGELTSVREMIGLVNLEALNRESDRAAYLETIHRLNAQLAASQGESQAVREMVGLMGLDTLERVGGYLAATEARLKVAETRLAGMVVPTLAGKLQRLPGKLRRLVPGKLRTLVRRLRAGAR
jgi:SAM-dependent methyltransferase